MAELVTRRENAIGWILFSNPARQNAVTYEMIVALPEALANHERDPKVRVIAFAGDDERTVVSGADVTEFAAARGSVAVAATYIRAMEDAYRAVVGARKPTLACIRGPWFGGGLSLALYCDLRICADDAELSQPGVRLGSALSYPSTKCLVDLIGPGHAAELLFTGRSVAAAEALALGLVNRVVPAAGLSAAFAALSEEIGGERAAFHRCRQDRHPRRAARSGAGRNARGACRDRRRARERGRAGRPQGFRRKAQAQVSRPLGGGNGGTLVPMFRVRR